MPVVIPIPKRTSAERKAGKKTDLARQRMFEEAAALAHAYPELQVSVPVGDGPCERVVLDGRLLSEDGTEVF